MKSVVNIFQGVREYLAPVLTESSFKERGVITPEEFIQAGDQLVYKCPTWRWESGKKSLQKSYLPENKQYLVSKNVPCRHRVSALEAQYEEETETDENEEGESWLTTHMQANLTQDHADESVQDISSDMNAHLHVEENIPKITLNATLVQEHFSMTENSNSNKDTTENSAPDIRSFVDNPDDAAELCVRAPDPSLNECNIVRTRTYDLSITYDKYYQVPRIWLYGYDEYGQPLTADMMFEDIIQDYANRTVTVDPHPHHNESFHVSIHPCQHAAVMKRITGNMSSNNNNESTSIESKESTESSVRVDQYLFIFLKFMQSVIPTIDYDHTLQVDGKSYASSNLTTS